ncbi:hypothetical protein BpHYR1_049630 [Brachionus plicatilis]|uniref:Uncharacterized protein n=1 Tax=Brachionus plicatilis TaxID=10195 RepID=A0A3M7T2H5_BRAPC|nr:hypothetical protein BpHYR1_049630 [Brachionus plicatilis]
MLFHLFLSHQHVNLIIGINKEKMDKDGYLSTLNRAKRLKIREEWNQLKALSNKRNLKSELKANNFFFKISKLKSKNSPSPEVDYATGESHKWKHQLLLRQQAVTTTSVREKTLVWVAVSAKGISDPYIVESGNAINQIVYQDERKLNNK